jgi:glycerol uptake facilitator-like aquaporin
VLLENGLATTAILLVVIIIFPKESGAHVNPFLTTLQAVKDELKWGQATIEIMVQFAGGATGTLLATVIFAVSKVHLLY